jgi:pimeloyl-ACP methyl ester carboxylesterase
MTCDKRHQNNLTLVVFTYLVVTSLLIINLNSFSHSLQVAAVSGTSNNTRSGLTINTLIPTIVKTVRVGDIDVAYKMFGKGNPILLIPGFAMRMDDWEPNVLNRLASNHTVIIFDNRGIGKTSAGNKTWSIEQFANDTAGFLGSLKIEKPVDVLGFSLGGFIAQELTLMHPQKVNKLILYATNCGGKTSIPPQISPSALKSMISGNASKDTFLSTLFPKEWIKANTVYVQKLPSPMMLSKESIQHQAEVGPGWVGTCDRLSNITKPTLIITGTDDVTSPSANSLVLAEKIPGAWLVQIKGGGHGVMYQYPDKFSRVLLTFLGT